MNFYIQLDTLVRFLLNCFLSHIFFFQNTCMHVGFEQEKTVCCACTHICTRIVTNNQFYHLWENYYMDNIQVQFFWWCGCISFAIKFNHLINLMTLEEGNTFCAAFINASTVEFKKLYLTFAQYELCGCVNKCLTVPTVLVECGRILLVLVIIF